MFRGAHARGNLRRRNIAMTKMKHEQRKRYDMTTACNAQDALHDARFESARRRAAIADSGKLTTLKFGGTCLVCRETLDAGTEAVWFPGNNLSHVLWQCPARLEYRSPPKFVQLPRAGRDEMMKSAR
jgi:hypothetical protein